MGIRAVGCKNLISENFTNVFVNIWVTFGAGGEKQKEHAGIGSEQS